MHLSIVATAGACESSRWSRSSLTDRTAVDRAMRHQVASPVEFVAHELLRACQKMQAGASA